MNYFSKKKKKNEQTCASEIDQIIYISEFFRYWNNTYPERQLRC